MSDKQMKSRIQPLHDFEVNWIKAGNNNFIPLEGEEIIYLAETDKTQLPVGRTQHITYNRKKIGDGIHNINDLPFESNVLYVEQQLTKEQKKVARDNIGAISVEISETPKDGEILVYDAAANKLVNSGYTFETLLDKMYKMIDTYMNTSITIEENSAGGDTQLINVPSEAITTSANEAGGETLNIGG